MRKKISLLLSMVMACLMASAQENAAQPESGPATYAISQAAAPEWPAYATIYEVNVRQYTKEGTFNAFARHLPRLRDLGVDILWFMPIQPIGVKNRKGPLGSYYSIKDYTAVNPEFGTLQDFKRLVHKAHGMGFKVVLDWVANHSSWDNAWIENHPDWYSRDDEGHIIAPYDWTDVAKLNYDMYYLREAMANAMLFWVEEVHIDGFRCDVAGEVPHDFWEDIRIKLDQVKDIWMIAENEDQYYLMNKAFNANYGWKFHHLMNEVAKGEKKASVLIEQIRHVEEHYPRGAYPMNFITNHDENSWNGTVFERMGDGHQAFAVLTFTVPGMPLIYSGQEAGLNKRLAFFDKDMIDWSDQSLMPFYTKLNSLKAENPALWNGEAGGGMKVLKNDQADRVISFVREKDGNKVVVIINLTENETSANISMGEQAGKFYNVFAEKMEELAQSAKMNLNAWEYRVLIVE
jgi:glycosidase